MATTWRGVDLRNVSFQRTYGDTLLEESYLRNTWLGLEGGKLADQCSDDGVLHFCAAEGTVEHVQLNSSHRSLGIQTERWDDYVAGLLHLLSRLASWRQAFSAWARALGLFLGGAYCVGMGLWLSAGSAIVWVNK